MSDHEELADEHEKTADRLERESERVAQHADDARSKLESARGDAMIPQSLGQDDPGHRVPSNADLKAEQDAEEEAKAAEEAEPDTIGESVDKRLGDLDLGSGGERGEDQLDDSDETPGGGDYDDVTPEGGSEDDD